MRLLIVTTGMFVLSGCATLSFAPPAVRMDRQVFAENNQTFFNAVCTPNHSDTNPPIDHDAEGALALIDNYILTYRCQRDRAAEGRQFFEVPGFLALAGGATAAAFGAPTGVAIATGAASAALNSGKGYYAPKDKAKVLSDGITAMLCIHNEAVGIDGPTLEAISDVQKNSGEPKPNTETGGSGSNKNDATDDNGPAVGMNAERQYFNMISTALWSVEQVVADRLSNSGKEFEMAGVQAQLDKLKQEVVDKTKAAGTTAEAADPIVQAPPPPPPPAVETASDAQGRPIVAINAAAAAKRTAKFDAATAKVAAIGAQQVGQTMIQLKTLKPKLDQCVVQAKV